MAAVDYDALHDSDKGLVVIFIIILTISSASLLVRLIPQKRAECSVRRITVAFLTLGNLLLVFFSLVVTAIIIFSYDPKSGYDYDMSCKTVLLALVYRDFYYPFVYAMGLLAIGTELCLANERSSGPSKSNVVKIAYVTVPWLFGVVVILPLVLEGTEWNNHCIRDFSRDRVRAILWLGSLGPSILVLVAAIFPYFIILYNTIEGLLTGRNGSLEVNIPSFPNAQNQQQRHVHQQQVAATVDNIQLYQRSIQPVTFCGPSTTNQHPIDETFDTNHNSQPYCHFSPNCGQPTNQSLHDNDEAPTTNQNPSANHKATQSQESSTNLQHPVQHECPTHNVSGPTSRNTFDQFGIPLQTTRAQKAPRGRDHFQETRTFIAVAVVYFCTTAPYDIFILSYSLDDGNDLDELAFTVINQILFWLLTLRWFLINIVWLIWFK